MSNNINYEDPFFLHMFMDGNIPTGIGNNSIIAMEHFDDHIIKECESFKGNKLFSSENCKLIQKVFNNVSKEYHNIPDIENIENKLSINLNIGNDDFPDEIRDINKMVNLYYEIIEKYSNQKDKDSIKKMNIILFNKLFTVIMPILYAIEIIVSNRDDCFFPSGYSTENGAHLVGFYYKYISDNNFRIVIANSGDGVEYHGEIENQDIDVSKYRIICETENVTKQQLLKIMIVNICAKIWNYNKIAKGYIDNKDQIVTNYVFEINECIKKYNIYEINDIKSLYEFYAKILGYKKFTDINFSTDINYYHESQLSGSCTYYGIFYILYYLAYKNQKLDGFLKEYEIIKFAIAQKIVNNITNQDFDTIREKDINILKFFNEKYRINITTFLDVYEKYLSNQPKLRNKKNYESKLTVIPRAGKLISVNNIINKLKDATNVYQYMEYLNELVASKYYNNYASQIHSEIYVQIYDELIFKYIVIANSKNESFYNLDEDNNGNYDNIKNFLINSHNLINSIINITYGFSVSVEKFNNVGMPNQNIIYLFILNIIMKSIQKYQFISEDQYNPTEFNEKLHINTTIEYEYPFNLLSQLDVISKYASYLINTSELRNGDHNKLLNKFNIVDESLNNIENNDDVLIIKKYIMFMFNEWLFEKFFWGCPFGVVGVKPSDFLDVRSYNFFDLISLDLQYYNYTEKKIDKPSYIIYDNIIITSDTFYYKMDNKPRCTSILQPGKYKIVGNCAIITCESAINEFGIHITKDNQFCILFPKRKLQENIKYNNENTNLDEILLGILSNTPIIINSDKGGSYDKPNSGDDSGDEIYKYRSYKNYNADLVIETINNNNIDILNEIKDLNNFFPQVSINSYQIYNEIPGGLMGPKNENMMPIKMTDYYYREFTSISIESLETNIDKFNDIAFIFIISTLLITKHRYNTNFNFTHKWLLDNLNNRIMINVELFENNMHGVLNKNDHEFIIKYLKSLLYFFNNNNDITILKLFMSLWSTFHLVNIENLRSRLIFSYISNNEIIFDQLINPIISKTYFDLCNKYGENNVETINSNNIKKYKVCDGKNNCLIFYDIDYIILPDSIKNKKYLFKNITINDNPEMFKHLKSVLSPYKDSILFETIPINDTDQYENIHKLIIEYNYDNVYSCFQIIQRDGKIEIFNFMRYANNDFINNFVNKLSMITKSFLIWKNLKSHNEFKIELPNHMDANGKPLEFKIINNEIFYKMYKIKTDYSYPKLLRRFIYGLDNVFMLYNNNKYKILIINYDNDILKKILNEIFSSVWINIKSTSKKKNHIKKINDNYDTSFYIININYTGLFLNITNSNAFISYFISCNYAQKISILEMLYRSSSHFLPDKNIELLLKYPNTPYNYHFDIIYNLFNNNKNTFLKKLFNISGLEGLIERQKYYIKCYNIIENNNKNIFKNDIKINIDVNLKKFINVLQKRNEIKYGAIVEQNVPNIHVRSNIISFINSDNMIKNEKSNGEFIGCEFGDYSTYYNMFFNYWYSKKPEDNPLQNISQLYNCMTDLNIEKHKIYDRLSNIDFCEPLTKIIIDNHQLFYKLLELTKISEICSKINKLSCVNNTNCCNEVLTIAGIIDDFYVSTYYRRGFVSLFEILFGNFIRHDQNQKFRDIEREIHENRYYNIHQMLMGKGKTSVITPLLIFKYLFDNDAIKNILIILPKHLINQTYNMLVKNYGYVFDCVTVKKMNITRSSQYDEIKSFFIQKLDIKDYFNIKNIIITDIASMQSIQLNCIINKWEIPIDKDNTLFIFDEIDTLSDPLSNELNYPVNIDQHDEYTIITIKLIISIVANLIENKSPLILDNNIRRNTINTVVNKVIENYNWEIDRNSPKIKYMIRKITNTFDIALQKIYNKDYGFDKHSSFIAIPYSGVDSPISGSEFTDLEIKLFFTCLSYFINGLREIDITNIKNKIKQLYKKYMSIPLLFEKHSLIKLLNNSGVDISIKKTKFDKIDNIKINEKNFDIISYYLFNDIFPTHIKQYTSQYNSSFIDIVGNTFSEHKIGFSGTVSNIHIDILGSDIIKKDKQDYNVFIDISNDQISTGAIYSAMLGITQNNDKKPKIMIYPDENNMFEQIIDILRKGNYDVLVDTGAFLREIKPIDVINRIMKIANHKTYAYIDENDITKYINTSNETNNSIFIYYDQKHTVGIDIPQPYNLKGLVTVNYFNRFTDISQGLFRLRKMNYGHYADFLVIDSTNNIKTSYQLLMHLLNEDTKYKKNTEHYALLQQIKYLRRKLYNKPEYYIDETFNEMNYIQSDADLNKNLYGKYIEKYCSIDLYTIKKLCNRINNIKYSMLGIQMNIEEQQQIVVSEQVSANIQQQMTRNYSVINHSNDINILKLDRFIEYYIDPRSYWRGHNISFKDNKVQKVFNVLLDNGIILSPEIFKEWFDILGNRESLMNKYVINPYNFHFIQSEKFILLIKGYEYTTISRWLNDFFVNYEVNKKIVLNNKTIVIKDRNGQIKMGNDADLVNDQKKISFVKYILGGNMGFFDILNCCKFMIETFHNLDMINILLEYIESFLLTITKNDYVNKLLNKYFNECPNCKKNEFDNFIKQNLETYNKARKFMDDIYEIIDINDEEMEILLNFFKGNQNGGNRNSTMYHKYLKYKYKYLQLKKLSN